MANFLAELKRRHVYHVAAAYVVAAWMVLQVVNNVAPGLNLPNSVVTFVIVLLSAGFPIALVFAWIFDIKATESADPLAPKVNTTGLDLVLIGALVAVIGIFLFQQFAAAPAEQAVQQTPSALGAAPAPAGISVAVLPFVNLSDDRQQEFFSDGITEEITAALAKVRGLTVIGRTSAFEFKGQNRDLRSIGQALGTTHLIEGSVRKVGNRVRITAQLIQVANGAHLWADNYDRDLTDIFAVQADIAEAISTELKVPLGLRQGDTLVRNRTNDFEFYDGYLRARSFYRARNIADAVKILEPAVMRDPGFAPAWALLARVYNLLPNYSPILRVASVEDARRFIQSSQTKAEMAARQAIRLDPNYAGGYGALADMKSLRGDWTEAEDLFRQAMALDPNDPDNIQRYSVLLIDAGRLRDGVDNGQRVRSLEPLVPLYNINFAHFLEMIGQNQASISMLEATSGDSGTGLTRNAYLALSYATAGRYSDAADALLAISGNQVSRGSVEDAARLMRTAPEKTTMPESLPVLEGVMSFVYAHVGAIDRVLELPERGADIRYLGLATMTPIWEPHAAPMRNTERFKTLVRKLGLVDYWRLRGWPDLCRPVGANDFECY